MSLPDRIRGVSAARVSTRLERMVMTQVQPRRRFTMRGEKYPYYAGTYNSAWHNERTVEIAIALRFIERYNGRRILEVGNVLSHYGAAPHEVVDKYEAGPGVLNVDVLDYRPDDRYDLIVCVSTLEHVGWDEDVADPTKPVRAVEHLVGLLAPGGALLVTVPLGYNPHVDRALRTDAFALDDIAYLKRISRDNRWREIDKSDVGVVRYGLPFPAANVVAVGSGSVK